MSKRVHVVAAVIRGHHKQVLIAKRPTHVHMGGLWEFPGGKVEQFEAPLDALKRELKEEVGLTVVSAQPLIQITHDYPDKQVYLDVWEVHEFVGVARGMEGQQVKWVWQVDLLDYEFPAANQAIVTATLLSSTCLITGDTDCSGVYLAAIEAALSRGYRLFILRPSCPNLDFLGLVSALKSMALFSAAQWQWHIDWCPAASTDFERAITEHKNFGVHFSARKMEGGFECFDGALLSASCHNRSELALAQQRGIDFLLLSPVSATKRYRPDELLGWAGFSALVESINIPVFALGGLTLDDIVNARLAGGQGVACIRDWWQ
ncbi:Nudix family hydrolase [Simiduia litorea]|uniref:Nudix family hydrolase n=1 Tax=Simiduia litorea TaxID=1435348 RepID=UPI0036F26674